MKYRNEDFFQKIGHITIFFATLDYFVTFLMIRLVDKDNPNHGKLPKYEETLGYKLAWLNELDRTYTTNPAVYDEMKTILSASIKISQERNRYIHDQWLFDDKLIPLGIIRRIKIEGSPYEIGPKSSIAELTIEELNSFLNEIGQLQKKFGELLKKMGPGKPGIRHLSTE